MFYFMNGIMLGILKDIKIKETVHFSEELKWSIRKESSAHLIQRRKIQTGIW